MDVPARRLRWLGVMLFSICLAGCSQPAGEDHLALPISPSAVSAGPSASLPSSEVARLGPGASYDPTGIWHFVVLIKGEVDETFDADMHQDADGNLSFIDDDGNLITLKRLGTGVVSTYRLSFVSDEEPCDFKVSGTARLDTRNETITINAALQDTDCSHFPLVVKATR